MLIICVLLLTILNEAQKPAKNKRQKTQDGGRRRRGDLGRPGSACNINELLNVTHFLATGIGPRLKYALCE